MDSWTILKLVGLGLAGGIWIGVTYGRRAALKDLYKAHPIAREVMLNLELEDPAKPWWRWKTHTYVYLGLVTFMVVLVWAMPESDLSPAAATVPQSAEARLEAALPATR
jgi:hypothetical protein